MKKMILLGFISTLIFSSEVFARESILMNSCSTDNNSVDTNSLLDHRGTLFRNLVTNGGQQYTIIENGSRTGYLKEVNLEQKMRNESSLDMGNILLPKYIIDCVIRKNGDKMTVWLQLNHKGAVERVVEKRNISDFQMEYYLNEIAQAVLNSSYRINDAAAPMRAEYNITLNSLTISQSDVEIKKIEYNYTNDKAKQFTETYNSVLQEADTLYAKKSFQQAAELYGKIEDSMEKSLAEETKNSMSSYRNDIKKRIFNSWRNHFNEKIKNIDDELNTDIFPAWYESDQHKRKFFYKYSDTEREIQNSPLVKSSEILAEFKDIFVNRYYSIIIKHNIHYSETKANEFMERSNFEYALLELDSISREFETMEPVKVFSETVDFKKNSMALNYYRKILAKKEKLKSNIKILSTNKLYSRCDIIEKSIAYYDILMIKGKENSEEAKNFIITFGINYELLKTERYPEISEESIKKQKETIAFANKSSVAGAYSNLSYKSISDAKEAENLRSENTKKHTQWSENLPTSILLFPFRYVFNVTISILDIFKITPLLGLGAGADTPIIHPGLGASYPVFEIKSAEGQNSRHPNDIRTLIWGALLVQHNECLAPLIDFYPIDYSYRYRETCQSKNGWNSAFKLNLWGSAGIGIHFEANLSRTLNFIPELFLLTDARQTFWNITDTGNSPRFAYEFTKPQSIEKILNWKIIEGITEPTYFQSIEICKVYAMHPASKDESYNIRLFIKDKSNNLICVKEK